MAKKTAVKKSATKAPKAPNPKIELTTADRGDGNDYGKGNALRHGRYSQGGLIDQFLAKSAKTGKGFTLAEVNLQRVEDNKNRIKQMNPISFSRFESHRIHMIEKHNAVIGKERDGEVIRWHLVMDKDATLTSPKGEQVTKDRLLEDLTIK